MTTREEQIRRNELYKKIELEERIKKGEENVFKMNKKEELKQEKDRKYEEYLKFKNKREAVRLLQVNLSHKMHEMYTALDTLEAGSIEEWGSEFARLRNLSEVLDIADEKLEVMEKHWETQWKSVPVIR